ncbi:alpha-acetolactate decarboxylase precursor [Pochonia chlamydosporia 170]|uniref:Alpha-acetolactate decarboxylase n=1 Tax=Pochonia chlamydosporia 170 TaxID=1380566 RepID=A0A179F534_METCM|nr:alpha-acetolactate decarboxylase precursor [Pochonia chlamydosporia 170]OAQ60536.1 alpha-acetolactate decarboxylase precursor [Pochonia chlamydosporia 170]
MAPASQLFQYSTASALMAGIASTGIRVSNLLSHGNYGLGTVANVDGEVVVVNGVPYHLQSSGDVKVLDDQQQLPFAMVAHFSKDRSLSIDGLPHKDAIRDNLLRIYPGATNRFIIFKLEGQFDTMTARVVRGQEYPGQSLSELGEHQKVNKYEHVRGTIVGFWSPSFMDGISVGGLHAHFLSSDNTFGGHVLALEASGSLQLTADVLNSFHLELPESNDFDKAKLEPGGDALKKVEG